MISVVIPTQNSEEALVRTLSTLVTGAADGTVREVVVVDGGSDDQTRLVAEGTGCDLISGAGGAWARCAIGAAAAQRGEFLMFLRPGVLLDPGWESDFQAAAERRLRHGDSRFAAVFRLASDDDTLGGSLKHYLQRLFGRCAGVTHPDQGLIISRSYFRELGGFGRRDGLAGADLVRRIGRRRLVRLRAPAVRVIADSQGDTISSGGALGALATLLLAVRLPVRLVAGLTGRRS
ncbi:glycosyltransferase [Pleomorphomonas diazotrophica]|uniref:Glycosyltransferase n=1 Tax=Pleomorphomonas diazotrophica TaxID=1166257 RepID=A0A1I4SBL4_9HYPH|nr:glycosyltransferase [Pleomorphomonas diazotrophica]PKR88836.1 glycosyltransferase [Pleomorphomonas diazotrophica]SFM61916.1 Glycosyl transferase family 2 [Pleomorphomonas diazotrophica]